MTFCDWVSSDSGYCEYRQAADESIQKYREFAFHIDSSILSCYNLYKYLFNQKITTCWQNGFRNEHVLNRSKWIRLIKQMVAVALEWKSSLLSLWMQKTADIEVIYQYASHSFTFRYEWQRLFMDEQKWRDCVEPFKLTIISNWRGYDECCRKSERKIRAKQSKTVVITFPWLDFEICKQIGIHTSQIDYLVVDAANG